MGYAGVGGGGDGDRRSGVEEYGDLLGGCEGEDGEGGGEGNLELQD